MTKFNSKFEFYLKCSKEHNHKNSIDMMIQLFIFGMHIIHKNAVSRQSP